MGLRKKERFKYPYFYNINMSPYKDPKVRAEKQKIYRKKFYKNNKQKVMKEVTERKKKLKKWYNDIRKQRHCSNCNEDKFYLLVFHHLEPTKKFKNVSTMVREGYSPKRILEEMDKCHCLCVNCHTQQHYLNRHL